MKNKASHPIGISISQIQADLHIADNCIQMAEKSSLKMAKPFKGQAGYHLQQAAEKMIKIQIYNSGITLDYSKLYKHGLDDLMIYSKNQGVVLMVPQYIRKHAYVISSWEAKGRYDLHMVVRIDVLKKAYSEIETWCNELIRCGYK